MADWKYIMIRVGDSHYPIIFPNILVHNDMAKAMRRPIYEIEQRAHTPHEVISAGFISGLIAASAHGKSESMNDLKSRGALDRTIINEMPYAHGRLDGISCEPVIVEAALRLLGGVFKGSEEAFSDDQSTTAEVTARRPKTALSSNRGSRSKYIKGQCASCGAKRGHHHRAECPYGGS